MHCLGVLIACGCSPFVQQLILRCMLTCALLRKCASLRAEKSELDDEVVMLNILVTIAGKYFKQSDN